MTTQEELREALDWALSEPRGKTRYDNPQQALNCFAKADAALARAEGDGDGWRPIETAPKDGTKFAVWDAIAGYVPWVYWGETDWCSEFMAWSGRPMKWRPLPAPPVSGGE